MLRSCNMARVACCLLATLWMFSVARGQESLAPPAAGEVIEAFNRTADWLSAWSVPDDASAEGGVTAPAASIELRFQAQRRDIVGRGVFVDRTGSGDVVAGAMRRAMREAEDRLPARNNAATRANLGAFAPNMLISLEIAGAFVPTGKESIAALNMIIQPGLEGVAVRIGEREEAMFPAEMLRTTTGGGDAAAVLIRRLRPDVRAEIGPIEGETAPTPGELIERGEAIVYKFAVSHVAQIEPGGAGRFLERGGRVVGAGEVRERDLAVLASGMARFLMSRRWPGVEAYGMGGTLQPMTGAVDPTIAPPSDQALAAMALRRFSRTPTVSAEVGDRAESLAITLLTQLGRVEYGEIEPWSDPATAGVAIIALTEGPLDGQQRVATAGLSNKCRQRVRAAFDLDAGFADGVPQSAMGPVAFALVRLAAEAHAQMGRGELDRESAVEALARAEGAVRRVLIEAGAGGLPNHLPWIGFAELELSELRGQEGEIPSAVALRDARELIWRNQLTAADAGARNADLVGGIVFTTARNPLPSWHSARAVAFPATMLGDERLTDVEERGGEILHLVAALRFIKQLTVDEFAAAMHVDPKGTLGGVRSALWDARMPASATAMSLLVVTEMMRSLDAISGD